MGDALRSVPSQLGELSQGEQREGADSYPDDDDSNDQVVRGGVGSAGDGDQRQERGEETPEIDGQGEAVFEFQREDGAEDGHDERGGGEREAFLLVPGDFALHPGDVFAEFRRLPGDGVDRGVVRGALAEIVSDIEE